MFKKPIEVNVDAKNVTVEHEIRVSYLTIMRTERVIDKAGKTAIAVFAVAALAKTTSEIAIHIAKTKIK